MALFVDPDQDNKTLRLGDAWKLGTAHADLEAEVEKWNLQDDTDYPASLLRVFNQDAKNWYQRCVTVADHGKFKCTHCLGERQAEERRQEEAEQSRSSGKTKRADVYVYAPLHNASVIRVLELEPALTEDAPLRAALDVCQNRESAHYVALSYTWGGIAELGELDLGTGKLATTGNLDLALRALRPKDTALRIWVDAVCIDQENLAEKAVQVSRMDETYKCAESVIAWLGPATDTSEAAVESLEILAELSKSPEYDTYTAPRPVALPQWTFPMEGDTAIDIQEMRTSTDIDNIFNRLWFTRMWIVQEIILARDISLQAGSATIVWEQFRRAVIMLYTADAQFLSTTPESELTDPLVRALTLVASRDRMKSMTDGNMLMRDYTNQIYGKTQDLREWGCQDERDRVFAILGFIPKDSSVHIKPDYTLDSRQVYIDFTRQHILYEGLLILTYAGLERSPGKSLLEYVKETQAMQTAESEAPNLDLDHLGLPSWMPDLRPTHHTRPGRHWSHMDFNAAMNRSPAVVLHQTCHHVLAVRGRVFDSIHQPLPPGLTRDGKTGIMDFVEAITYVGFVYRFVQDFYEQRGGYPTGESIDIVFDNVVTVDKTSLKLRRLAEEHHSPAWIDEMLGLLRRGACDNFSEIREILHTDPAKFQVIGVFFSCLSLLFNYDQCILTDQGYMGVAPMCSKLDKIAWINELQCLVVLRPVIDGQQYQLVGPCFLHGLMQGELLEIYGKDDEVCEFIELI